MAKTENFKLKYLKEVCITINQLIEKKERIVSVKRIREVRNIENEDRSIINFYWHSLKSLEKAGILKYLERGKYRIVKGGILLSNIIPNVCENCNQIIKRKDYQVSFTNIARKETFYFCNSACKKEWISKKVKEA